MKEDAGMIQVLTGCQSGHRHSPSLHEVEGRPCKHVRYDG